MKVLLDNCVHYRAGRLFRGHDVLHCRDMGWRELENGDLLAAAASASFDALVTTDKKVRYEHRLDALPIAVVEIDTIFTRLVDLQSVAFVFDEALEATRSFLFVSIGEDGRIDLVTPRG